MAEEDWPIAKITAAHVRAVVGTCAGVGFIIAGIVGYDLGKITYAPGDPVPTRWRDGVQWIQIVVGMAALAFAAYNVNQVRHRR